VGDVDYVITPVVKQVLPRFTLVDGGDRALALASLLNVRFFCSWHG